MVQGPRPERFLNSAVEARYVLRQVRRVAPDILVAAIPAPAFRKLRILARNGGWKISVVQRFGWPFFLRKLLRRRGFVVGAVLCLLVIYALSGHIWFISVSGAVVVPQEQILAVAREHGLRMGVPKSKVAQKSLERQILLAIDRLAWVNVEVSGTLATIRVAEKEIPEAALTQPGDVVARCDGVVQEIVTLYGIPVVAPGEVVTAGQLLISGLLPVQDKAYHDKAAKGEPPYIRAHGVVTARVWHEAVAEAGLLVRHEVPTGKASRRLHWQWGAHQGVWGAEADFTHYRERTVSWQPGWGSWRLPLRIIWETRHEVQVNAVEVNADEATANALSAAWEQVQAQLPPGAVVDKPAHIQMETVEDSAEAYVRVHIVVEAIEDIHQFQPITESAAYIAQPTVSRSSRLQPIPGP
jgi:similar to stage IV sporulation protein